MHIWGWFSIGKTGWKEEKCMIVHFWKTVLNYKDINVKVHVRLRKSSLVLNPTELCMTGFGFISGLYPLERDQNWCKLVTLEGNYCRCSRVLLYIVLILCRFCVVCKGVGVHVTCSLPFKSWIRPHKLYPHIHNIYIFFPAMHQLMNFLLLLRLFLSNPHKYAKSPLTGCCLFLLLFCCCCCLAYCKQFLLK